MVEHLENSPKVPISFEENYLSLFWNYAKYYTTKPVWIRYFDMVDTSNSSCPSQVTYDG